MNGAPVFDALGRRFTVECLDRDVRSYAWALLDGLRVADDTTSADDVDALTVDLRAADPASALTALIGTINLWAVAAAEGSLLLHAGAVSDDDGAVIVLCGPSGSGKSTLTASLVRSGFGYVTDETLCLDAETLRVTPFRKPLSLKPGSRTTLPELAPRPGSVAERCTDQQWLVPAPSLGGSTMTKGPMYPTVVVFPTHAPGSDVTVECLDPAETAYLLGSNSARLWWASGGGLAALARMARRTRSFRMTYGSTSSAVQQIRSLMGQDR